MKSSFSFSLTGKDWWKPYLAFWLIYLVLEILITRRSSWGLSPAGSTGLYLLVTLVLVVAVLILTSIFTIVFFRIFAPKLSVNGVAFSFRGSIGRYIGIFLLGVLLSIVTLGIYVPWFVRRVYAYLVSETEFGGEHPQFQGKGGKLFVYYLLAAILPMIIVIAIVVGLTVGSLSASGALPTTTTAVMSAVIFIVLVPFLYLYYRWLVNIRWKDVTLGWQTSFWPSCLFLFGQLFLTLVTAVIYWPAAVLRIYRYFMGKTVVTKPDGTISRLGFEGSIGAGFGLLWGQALLTIITVGIYAPWAFANVGRWLLSSTFVERTEAA